MTRTKRRRRHWPPPSSACARRGDRAARHRGTRPASSARALPPRRRPGPAGPGLSGGMVARQRARLRLDAGWRCAATAPAAACRPACCRTTPASPPVLALGEDETRRPCSCWPASALPRWRSPSCGGSDVAALRTTAQWKAATTWSMARRFSSSGACAPTDYGGRAHRRRAGREGHLAAARARRQPGPSSTRFDKMGWLCSDTAHLRFDGGAPCALPAGRRGRGLQGHQGQFQRRALGTPAPRWAFPWPATTRRWRTAQQRQILGSPLVGHQVVRHKLVDMQQRIRIHSGLAGDCGRAPTRATPGPIGSVKFGVEELLPKPCSSVPTLACRFWW